MEVKQIFNKELHYFFSKMLLAFKPEESEGVNGKVLYEIDGEFYILEIKDRKCIFFRTEMPVLHDTHITVSKDIFIAYMIGSNSLNNSFNNKDLRITGNLDLASSMEFIFEHPLKVEIWFYLLENSYIEKEVKGINYTFCFEIEKCTEHDIDGIEFITDSSTTYRFVTLNEKGCLVAPIYHSKPEVTYSIKEEDIISFLKGDFSFYEAFLDNKIEIRGPKLLATEFPRFFNPDVFPNKTIKNLNADNIFKVMHKMTDEIPEHMIGCIILFTITGKNRKNYYVNIGTDTIKVSYDNPDNKINTRIEMSENTFIDICKDNIHYVDAYTEGDILVRGNNKIGMDFNNIFKARFNYGY